MYTLKNIILAVEENNDFNNASWADWEDADHIKTTYFSNQKFEDIITEEMANEILANAIKTNGKSLAKDAEEYDLKVHGGHAFGGAGYWVDVLRNTHSC